MATVLGTLTIILERIHSVSLLISLFVSLSLSLCISVSLFLNLSLSLSYTHSFLLGSSMQDCVGVQMCPVRA